MELVRYKKPRWLWIGRAYGGGLFPKLVYGEMVGELAGALTVWAYLCWEPRSRTGLRWFGI